MKKNKYLTSFIHTIHNTFMIQVKLFKDLTNKLIIPLQKHVAE